jgi:hypothetical protein
MLGQDSWDRKAWAGKPGQDSQDRTARIGQPENVRMAQAGKEREDRMART